jgi:hypothetical protein
MTHLPSVLRHTCLSHTAKSLHHLLLDPFATRCCPGSRFQPHMKTLSGDISSFPVSFVSPSSSPCHPTEFLCGTRFIGLKQSLKQKWVAFGRKQSCEKNRKMPGWVEQAIGAHCPFGKITASSRGHQEQRLSVREVLIGWNGYRLYHSQAQSWIQLRS